jgi:hypothetical protein
MLLQFCISVQSSVAVNLAKKGNSQKEVAIEMLDKALQTVRTHLENRTNVLAVTPIVEAFAEIGEEEQATTSLTDLISWIQDDSRLYLHIVLNLYVFH